MSKKNIDYDDLKNQLESVWDRTLSTLNKGRSEVIRLSKMGKIKLDAQMMTRDKNYIFQKLGEETYKQIRAGKLNETSLKKWADKVDKINKNIKSCDTKINDLTKKKTTKRKTAKKK